MVFTNRPKHAHPATSSLARTPTLPPELSGWAQPLSKLGRAPKLRPRKPGGPNLQIALILMAAALVQQSFAATYVEGLTRSRKMSVSNGSTEWYNESTHNLEENEHDGITAAYGVPFDEDKFAYWTSRCSANQGDQHQQKQFLKTSLNRFDSSVGFAQKPYVRFEYEFNQDLAIKNVLILFNMQMMSASSFRNLSQVSITIKSSRDSSTSATSAISVASAKSATISYSTSASTQLVQEKEFLSTDAIGSGFFATGFTTPAKYLEITIYNEKDVAQDIIIDGLHLYDEANHLSQIPFHKISLTNTQSLLEGPFSIQSTSVLNNDAQPWIDQEMPRASWISSFQEADSSNQCIQIEPSKVLKLNFGKQKVVKDLLIVTEAVSQDNSKDASDLLLAINLPNDCHQNGFQGAFYGRDLKISYRTGKGSGSVEKVTMNPTAVGNDVSFIAGTTVNDWTVEEGKSSVKTDLKIQYLEFKAAGTNPVRICHLGVFVKQEVFEYSLPTITQRDVTQSFGFEVKEQIPFTLGGELLSSDCYLEIKDDRVNDGQSSLMTVECVEQNGILDLTLTATSDYNWDNFSQFRANRMSQIDLVVKFKTTDLGATYTEESLSIPIQKVDTVTPSVDIFEDVVIGNVTSMGIAALVWSTEPTSVVLSMRTELKQSSSLGVVTFSQDAHKIIADTPIRDATSNMITFDINLLQQTSTDLQFGVGDVLTFWLVYTYTDMAAAGKTQTQTVTQTFDIHVVSAPSPTSAGVDENDGLIQEQIQPTAEEISNSTDSTSSQWVVDDEYFAQQQYQDYEENQSFQNDTSTSNPSEDYEEETRHSKEQDFKTDQPQNDPREEPESDDKSSEDEQEDPAYIDPFFFDFLASIRPQKSSSASNDTSSSFDPATQEIAEEVEKIVIVPKITEVNPVGELKIAFDPPYAKVPSSWNAIWDPIKKAAMTPEELKFIDTMITEVFQVIFIKNSEESPQSYFDQSVASFTPSGMMVNLDFSDPLLVSQGEVPDQVSVRLLKNFFTEVDETYYQQLQGSSRRQLETTTAATSDTESPFHIFEFDVPKQVKSKAELDSLQKSGEAAQSLIGTQFITFAILHIVMRGAMSQMWNIFNTMQLLTAIPLFAINTPSNVLFLNEEINKISNFQIVKKEQLYDWVIVPIFDTSTSEQKKIEAGVIVEASDADLDQLEKEIDAEAATALNEEIDADQDLEIQDEEDESYLDQAFKGANLIMAILFVALTMIVFVLLILLVVLCRKFIMARGCKCLQTILVKIESKLMFNSVLRAILMSYFLFAIVSMQAFYKVNFESAEGLINLIVAILLVTFLLIFPFAQHNFLLKNQEKLKSLRYIDKYGSLYQNVNVEKSHSLRFTLYFCLRRIIFAFAIIVLKDAVIIQILVTDLTVMGMLSFYVAGLPMIDGPNNFIQIFNEIIICFVIISMVIFTNFIPNPVDRYDYGWYLLYFIGASVCVNMIILAVNITKTVYMAIKKRMRKKLLTKHIFEVQKKEVELLNQLQKIKLEELEINRQKQTIVAVKKFDQVFGADDSIKSNSSSQQSPSEASSESDSSSESVFESSSQSASQSASQSVSQSSSQSVSQSDVSEVLSQRSLSDAVAAAAFGSSAANMTACYSVDQIMPPVKPRQDPWAVTRNAKYNYADDQEMQLSQITLTGIQTGGAGEKTQFVPGTAQISVLDDPSTMAIINENDIFGIDEKLARQEAQVYDNYRSASKRVTQVSASKILPSSQKVHQAQQAKKDEAEIFEEKQDDEKRQSRRALLNKMLAKAKLKTMI